MKIMFVRSYVHDAVSALVNMQVGHAMAEAKKQVLAELEKDIKEAVDRRVAETFMYFVGVMTPAGLVAKPYDPPRESWEKMRQQVSNSIYEIVKGVAEQVSMDIHRSTASSENFIDSVVERINRKQVRRGNDARNKEDAK